VAHKKVQYSLIGNRLELPHDTIPSALGASIHATLNAKQD
jgi:hypothetical protein